MALLEPEAQMEPNEDALQFLLRAFHTENLAKRKDHDAVGQQPEGRSWAYEFSLFLRRFQNDCERIVFRHTRLQQSKLLEAIRLTGKEAEFLESLCSRIDSRLRVEMLNVMFVDELKEFLLRLIAARRQAASFLPK